MSADIKERLKNHKLWPYKEAEGILARHDFDPSYEYRFQTGFGPSGFPHIGTFGEAVRTGFIMDAVRSLGFKTRLIVFSDDLDGLSFSEPQDEVFAPHATKHLATDHVADASEHLFGIRVLPGYDQFSDTAFDFRRALPHGFDVRQ